MKTQISLLATSLLTTALLASSTTRSVEKAEQEQPERAADKDHAEEFDEDARKLNGEAAKVSAQARELGKASRELNRRTGPAASSVNAFYDMLKPAREASRPLVILKDQGDVKSLGEVEEDLSIMARILQKAASGRGDSRQAMGILLNGSVENSKSIRSFYLEGYGAIFMLGVNFPFSPPAAAKEETETKEDTNAEWEEARRELHHPPEGPNLFKWEPSYPGSMKAEAYDEQKVENFKKSLTSALKNAVHIRRLKSDESVIVVVNGRSQAGDTKVVTSGRGASSSVKVVTPPGDPLGTQMILRVRRSDVEAFQKEKMSFEDFRKKVSLSVN